MSKEPNQHLFMNRINKTDYNAQILELSNAIADGTEALKKLLLGTETPATRSRKPEHNNCDGFTEKDSNPTKTDEKRFCKCLFYLNGDSAKQCEICLYPERFALVGDEYQIKDYEVPPFFYEKGIRKSGIDLVIQEGNVLYATEVKPYKGNDETLLRMVAEIMTYTLGYPNGKYKKAIAFFEKNREEKSKTTQQKEYDAIHPSLVALLKTADITVFRFEEAGEKAYKICKL